MHRLLLALSALGIVAAGPSFASPSLQHALTASAALNSLASLQAVQRISRSTSQTREQRKYNLWAHGRPRDEMRGLGMTHYRC